MAPADIGDDEVARVDAGAEDELVHIRGVVLFFQDLVVAVAKVEVVGVRARASNEHVVAGAAPETVGRAVVGPEDPVVAVGRRLVVIGLLQIGLVPDRPVMEDDPLDAFEVTLYDQVHGVAGMSGDLQQPAAIGVRDDYVLGRDPGAEDEPVDVARVPLDDAIVAVAEVEIVVVRARAAFEQVVAEPAADIVTLAGVRTGDRVVAVGRHPAEIGLPDVGLVPNRPVVEDNPLDALVVGLIDDEEGVVGVAVEGEEYPRADAGDVDVGGGDARTEKQLVRVGRVALAVVDLVVAVAKVVVVVVGALGSAVHVVGAGVVEVEDVGTARSVVHADRLHKGQQVRFGPDRAVVEHDLFQALRSRVKLLTDVDQVAAGDPKNHVLAVAARGRDHDVGRGDAGTEHQAVDIGGRAVVVDPVVALAQRDHVAVRAAAALQPVVTGAADQGVVAAPAKDAIVAAAARDRLAIVEALDHAGAGGLRL